MTVGIKECSKCEYNLKCTKCVLPKQCQDMKAEIEKLQTDYYSMQSTLAKMSMGVEQAKAEAIKEFAEKVKALFADGDEVIDEIDNLVKEMVGESDV